MAHEHGHDHGHGNGDENPKAELAKIIIGTVLFGLSFAAAKLFPAFPLARLFLLAVSYLVLGWEVVFNALKGIIHGEVFDENFLMTVATIGAAVLGDYNEAVFVMLFYSVGEFAQDLAVDKARDNIEELMDIDPPYARIVREDGTTEEIEPAEVKVGNRIQVLAGELVPVDGIAVTGGIGLDTKAITGESIPQMTGPGSRVLSGSVVLDAPLVMEAAAVYEDSTVNRIMELVEESQESKAPTEKFITSFARIYTPFVTGLAVLLALVPPLFDGQWQIWTHRALTFLVISCPCALVLSIPLTFFAGIGSAAAKGILIKGGTILQNLAKTDTFVFDKTGTLTTGEFKVRNVVCSEGFDRDRVLRAASALESNSHHPIAKAICAEYQSQTTAQNIREYAGKGLQGEFEGSTVLAGNLALMKDNNVAFKSEADGTAVYVAIDGKPAGFIVIGDSLKDNARAAVDHLKEMGVKKTVMLSGDKTETARITGNLAGLDAVYGDLLPQDKVERITELKKEGMCAYVGDGINDAPVLMTADCAVAMGKTGSASAIEAAGIVIMNDNLQSIPTALGIADKTVRIAAQNIVFALGIKMLCMVLGALGVTGMGVAVFADTGVALLCVLNSLRALHVKGTQVIT